MRFALSFVIVSAFWVLLGGHGVLGHFGVPTVLFFISTLFCAWIGGHLFFPSGKTAPGMAMLGRFIAYTPWLMWQIAKSNVDLVYRTLHPDMPINPRVIRFRTDLDSDIGETMLANSITLTPGTVTIGIENGEYVVHAIADGPADSLLAGDMQRRVKWVESGGTAATPVPPAPAPPVPPAGDGSAPA